MTEDGGKPARRGAISHLRDKPWKNQLGIYGMKYRTKVSVVEAFQMTEASRASNEGWPQFMHLAWNTGYPGLPGKLSPEDFPNSDGTDKLVLKTLEGECLIEWGDWIVQDAAGEIFSCVDILFRRNYTHYLPTQEVSDMPEDGYIDPDTRCEPLPSHYVAAKAKEEPVDETERELIAQLRLTVMEICQWKLSVAAAKNIDMIPGVMLESWNRMAIIQARIETLLLKR